MGCLLLGWVGCFLYLSRCSSALSFQRQCRLRFFVPRYKVVCACVRRTEILASGANKRVILRATRWHLSCQNHIHTPFVKSPHPYLSTTRWRKAFPALYHTIRAGFADNGSAQTPLAQVKPPAPYPKNNCNQAQTDGAPVTLPVSGNSAKPKY